MQQVVITQDNVDVASGPALPPATQANVINLIDVVAPGLSEAFKDQGGMIGTSTDLPNGDQGTNDGRDILVDPTVPVEHIVSTIAHEMLHVAVSSGNGGVNACEHAAINFTHFQFMIDFLNYIEKIETEFDTEIGHISCAEFKRVMDNAQA